MSDKVDVAKVPGLKKFLDQVKLIKGNLPEGFSELEESLKLESSEWDKEKYNKLMDKLVNNSEYY